jgi:hypothetical protein
MGRATENDGGQAYYFSPKFGDLVAATDYSSLTEPESIQNRSPTDTRD